MYIVLFKKMEGNISPAKSKRLLLFTTLAVIGLLLMSALVIFFYQRASAAENITGNILQFSKFSSFRANISILKGEVTMNADYHTNSAEYSRVGITVYRVNPRKNGVLKSDVIFNNTASYPSISYSHMHELIRQIAAQYIPGLEKYQSYNLIKPLLFNNRYAHIDIRPYKTNILPKFDNKTTIELYDMLNKAMIVRTSSWKISRFRIGPTRYSIGFNKERLLAFIDRIQALDPNRSYASIRQLIVTTNGWDKNIVIIDIDSRGRLIAMKGYLPLIPKTTIDQQIPTVFTLPLLSNLKEKFYENFYSRKNKDLVEIVDIKIHSLINASKIKAPNRPIELAPVIALFQQELTATASATPSATPTSKSKGKPFAKPSISPSASLSATIFPETKPGKGNSDKTR